MKVAFRLSSMGFGGAERVFLSVAEELRRTYQTEVSFVVDNIGKGETENLVLASGFQLVGLGCTKTSRSILPLKKYIDAYKPEILISAYTDTNFAALISSKLARHQCKVIVSEHASLKEHWQHATIKRRVALNFYVRYGYRLADHILTVSEGIAKQLISMGYTKEKISCIYNPVRFQSNTTKPISNLGSNKKPIILAVGRITRQKDYLTLLQAFKSLKDKKDCRLVIVGGVHEIAEKTKLDAFIESSNLTEEVEFVGFTENVEVYYAQADVFILSSAWEGFGNVIVEALAFGLPVVSTNCNHGPSEILQQGKFGKLVAVGDSSAMATAISQVLETNPFPIEHQIARAKDFSESRIGEAYHQLFQKVISTS